MGYTFGGYYDAVSGGTQYYTSSGARNGYRWGPADGLSSPKLYAHWTVKTYGVAFDAAADGAWIPTGYDGSAAKTVTFDAAFGVLPVPTYGNHIFTDWYTTASGTGQSVTPTAKATMDTLSGVKTVTDDAGENRLYARYITLETHVTNASVSYPKSTRTQQTNETVGNVLTYNTDTKQSVLTFTVKPGAGYSLPGSIAVTADGRPVAANYDKNTGVFTVALSSVKQDGTGVIAVTADAVSNGCSVTLKTVGGTLSGSDFIPVGGLAYTYAKTVTANETLPTPAAPKGSGTVAFGGWYTDASYTTRVYSVSADDGAGSEGLTLYAKWTYSALTEQSDKMYYAYGRDTSDVRGIGTITKTTSSTRGWNRYFQPTTSTKVTHIQTTYNNAGFEAYYTLSGLPAAGQTATNYGGTALTFVTTIGRDIFTNIAGTDLYVAQVMTIEGGYVTISYLVENRGSAPVSGFSLGAAADVQINDNDAATITKVSQNGYTYLQMLEGTGSKDKVFRLYVEGGAYGVTDAAYWYGLYGAYSASSRGSYYTADGANYNRDASRKSGSYYLDPAYYTSNVFNAGMDSNYNADGSGSAADSALAYHWTVDVPAGETVMKTVKLGVGDAEVMARTSVTLKAEGGTFASTGSDTLSATGAVVTINDDGTVSADGTVYTAPERSGYDFAGWVYANGTPATGDITADTVVYAAWQAAYTRAVTNNCVVKQGSGSSVTTVANAAITLRYESYDNGSGAKGGYVLQGSTEYGLVNENMTFTAAMDITDGYLLPQSIEVTSGGQRLTNGTGYLYTVWNNQTRATLVIDATRLRDDIVITAVGHPAPAQTPTGASVTIPSQSTLPYGYGTGPVMTAAVSPASIDKHTYSYQWYETVGDINEGGTPVGTNSKTLTFTTSRPAGDYHFYCVVTATRTDNGQSAAIVSNTGTVTVQRAAVTPTLTMTGWVYGGQASEPLLQGFADTQDVSYTYYTYDEANHARGDLTSESGLIKGDRPTLPGTYVLVASYAGSENCEPFSVETNFTISAGQTPAPTATGHTDESVSGRNDGTLYGVNDAMQYRKSVMLGGMETGEWQNVADCAAFEAASGTITGLAPGQYDLRYIIKENYAAGVEQRQTIAAGRKLTVTFIYGNGMSSTSVQTDWHEAFDYPAEPTRAGHTFTGWSIAAADLSGKIESDKTVTARWAARSFTVSFDVCGGSALAAGETSKTATYDTPYGPLPVPARTGYTFAGWYTAAEGGSRVLSITTAAMTADETLYAHWTENTYTYAAEGTDFTADARVGSASGSGTVKYTDTLTMTLTPDENKVISTLSVLVGGAHLVDVTTEGAEQTITGSAGIYSRDAVTGAVTVTLKLADLADTAPGSIVVTAGTEVSVATLRFVTNGGSTVSAETARVGAELTMADYASEKAGYTLTWCSDAALSTPVTTLTLTEDATVYALWTAGVYTVTFNANGGTANTASKAVTYGGQYGMLPTPTRAGHGFTGWYTAESGGTKVTAATAVTITENQTLYARWTVNTATMQYRSNNTTFGTVSRSSESLLSTSAAAPLGSTATAKYGYRLAGWYKGSTRVSTAAAYTPPKSAAGVYETATYLATFEAVSGINVSFNADYTGAPTIGGKTVTYATAYGALPTPTRAGFTFAGWFTASYAGTEVTDKTVVSVAEAHTLYARWTEDDNVQITYQSQTEDGGTVSVTSESVPPVSGTVSGSVATAKAGYTFNGWYANGVRITDSRVSGTKLTPAKTNGMYAAAVYTAAFDRSTYTVSFNANGTGVTITGENKTLHYGDVYGALPTATRSGYTFDGWFTAAGSGARQVQPTDTALITANQTLYAHWTVDSYTLTVDVGVNHDHITTEGETPFSLGTKRVLRIMPNMGYKLDNANLKIWLGGTDVTNLTGLLTREITTQDEVRLTIDVSALNTLLLSRTSAPTALGDIIVETAVTQIFRTITFTTNGGTLPPESPSKFAMSDGLAALPVPTKTGCTFDGWYTAASGGTKVTATPDAPFGKGAAADVTLYARWTDNTYPLSKGTGSYTVSGGSTVVAYGTPVTLTVTPHSGYTLDKITVTVGGVDVTSRLAVTNGTFTLQLSTLTGVTPGTVHVTADTSKIYHTVTFNAAGGTAAAAQQFAQVDGLAALPASTRTGYTFAGWYLGSTKTTAIAANTASDVALTAHWTANTYAVSTTSGHVTLDKTAVTYDSAAAITVTPDTGYTLESVGVSVGGTALVAGTGYALSGGVVTLDWNNITTPGEVVITAAASQSTYALTFDGGYPDAPAITGKTVTYGGTYGTLPAPTRTGYTFSGWYTTESTGGSRVESATAVTVTAPQTLYARWTVNSYTLTWHSGGGTLNGGTAAGMVTYGTALTAPTATRTGYTFAGWTPAVAGTMPAADTDYTAQWTAKTCTVSFNANGGSVTTDSKTVTYDSPYGTLPAPTYTGYTFSGWYTAQTGGEQVSDTTSVTGTADHTLYARWTVNTYAITSAGSITTGPTNIVYHSNTTIIITPDDNMTIGSADDIKVYVGTTLLPTSAYNVGRLGGDNWSVTLTLNGIAGDVTIAVSAVFNKYTVTFTPNGGSVTTDSKTVTYGDMYGTLPAPTRTGYTFTGWYTESVGGEQVSEADTVALTADQTLYAHWTADTYAVTFNTVGGGTAEGITVTYGAAYGTLPAPTRTGHTFAGWYTAQTGGSRVESTTPVTITAAQALYAHWSDNSYTVTFDPAGGSVTPESKAVTYGGTYGTLPTPTRTGYTFAGWYTAQTGGSRVESTTAVTITAHQTLYARWTEQQYAIAHSGSHFTVTGADTVLFTEDVMLTVTPHSGYTLGALTVTVGGVDVTNQLRVTNGAFTLQLSTLTGVEPGAVHIAAETVKVYHTATFDAAGGTAAAARQFAQVDGLTALPVTTRAGYTFDGWYLTAADGSPTGSALTAIAAGTDADAALTAKWTANTYTASTTSSHVTLAPATVTYDAPADVTLTADYGYTLGSVGVSVGGTALTAGTGYALSEGVVTLDWSHITTPGHVVITADTTKNTHTVTFDAADGSDVSDRTFTEAEGLASLPVSTRTGYTFDGWYDGETALSAIASHTERDVALTAHWTVNRYALTVTSNNANTAVTVLRQGADEPVAYTAGATAAYDEGMLVVTAQAQTGESIKSAVLKVGGVIVQAKMGGNEKGVMQTGIIITPAASDRGGSVTARVNLTALPTGIVPGDIELAVVTETVFYTLGFDTDGGSAVFPKAVSAGAGNTTSLPSGTAIVLGDYVTRKTGSHATWYTDAEKTATATDFTLRADTTLHALWTDNTYTVAFGANGGTETMADQTFTYGVSQTLSANAFVRTGYTFAGWATAPGGGVIYTDEQSVLNMTEEDGATLRLYAVWTELPAVTVTYTAGSGGAVSRTAETLAPVTGRAEGSTASAAPGYGFDGWYSGETRISANATLVPEKTQGVYEPADYTAAFVANRYTVAFHANGGVGTMEPLGMTYGTAASLTANAFSRKGFTFAGWNSAANGSGRTYANAASVSNLTIEDGGTVALYALWTLNPTYTISGTAQADDGTAVSGAAVTLVKGTTVIDGPITTDSSGGYSFTGVESGTYNVVATSGGKTVTFLVNVESTNLSNITLVLPVKVINSKLIVDADELPDKAAKIEETVVGGLDSEANAVSEKAEQSVGSDTDIARVDIEMTVTRAAADNTSPQQAAITRSAGTASAIEFVEMTVEKTVITTDDRATTEPLTQLDTLLRIVIPFDTTGKNSVKVLRYHGARAEALPTGGTGERYEVLENAVAVYANKFSTYAIAYSQGETPTPTPTPGGGSSAADTPLDITVTRDSLDNSALGVGRDIVAGTADYTPGTGYTKADILRMQKDSQLELVTSIVPGSNSTDERSDLAAAVDGKLYAGTTPRYFTVKAQLRNTQTGVIVATLNSLSQPLTFTVRLSSAMQQAARDGAKLYLISAHNGKVSTLALTLNADKTVGTFSTDRFYSYAVVAMAFTASAGTRDNASVVLWIALALCSAMALGYMGYRRRKWCLHEAH